MNLFSTKHNTLTLVLIVFSSVRTGNCYSHMGCYADTYDRALNDFFERSHTVETCNVACSSFTYFSLQDGHECWCDNSLSDATKHGEATGCSGGTGGPWRLDLYVHPTDPCAGVDCGGACGSCDAQTGECVYDDGVCNVDNDLCNGEETCDTATGTCVEGTPLECADGDPCNGEEYCDSETGCMPGTNLTCPNGFICTEDVGCERNCDLFAIDGYLEECSVVMSDSQQYVVALEETLTAVNDGQDIAIANAEDYINALQAECDVITARLDAFVPLAEMGEQTGQKGQGIIGVPQLGGVGQNNLIILLLISNMVLVVALIAVVCWYRTKLHTVRYETVKYYSSAADEENEQLNK